MNGNSLFADTNILIYLLQGNPEIAEILNGKEIYISFITELELLAFPNLNRKEEKEIKTLLGDLKIININTKIKDLAIQFRKSAKLKLPDALIAASAYYFNIPLVSSDGAFSKVKGLNLIKYVV